jgi:hypothetical protein
VGKKGKLEGERKEEGRKKGRRVGYPVYFYLLLGPILISMSTYNSWLINAEQLLNLFT